MLRQGELVQETESPTPTDAQNLTCALKCICLVALFFIPVFSIHFDFILWTYCMSRSRTRAAPVVERATRSKAKKLLLTSRENLILAESTCCSGVTGFLYLNQECYLGIAKQWISGPMNIPDCTPDLLYTHT